MPKTLDIPSLFCNGLDPFTTVEWKIVNAVIINSSGKEVFRQNDVEVPEWWNETTVNVVAEKYFRVVNGVKEKSAKQMFSRVANWIAKNGLSQGVLTTKEEADIFANELIYMGLHGMHAFNSPVWFNVGTLENPQCSACFIQGVGDDMDDIMDLAKKEVMLFKGGSGTGSNLSDIRSSYEPLARGGLASGPVSFMEGYDSFAGVTKSGGVTRRAAKMNVLNIDHPDILEQKNGKPGFITCKSDAEQFAHDLWSTGKYTAEFNVPNNVYDRAKFQNANNSVRVTDDFMSAVVSNGFWETKDRNGAVVKKYLARELWSEISKAAWACGDPGIQFHDTTNKWHTCPSDGNINASNPCQPAWATVLTPTGIRTLGEISVGDIIWSGKQWTAVTRKVSTGIKPVYNYYTRAGIFSGTEEHKVISDGERVMAQDANTMDVAQGKFYEGGYESSLDYQTVVDGLVLGDGYIKVSNEGANHYPLLCIGRDDASYFADKNISEFINSAPFDNLAHRVKTSLTREELPYKPLSVIPQRFFQGSTVQICSFLRGLYSANGSVVSNRVTLKATSFQLINQVQQMLSSIGIQSYYTTNRATDVTFSNGVYTSKESYDLNITTDRDKFASLINFIQPYKQEKLREACTTKVGSRGPKTSFEVVGKLLVGEEPVFDIEVAAEEHTYWTGGLLVSNCSEYLFLDDTACNLSSLNLLTFSARDMSIFRVECFSHAVEVAIVAKEIIVEASSYPSEVIKTNSHRYRTLGLGYTNLGALLTSWGLPYDSDAGRDIAAQITALMGGVAYEMSAKLASVKGVFDGYKNVPMLRVIHMHREEARKLHNRAHTHISESAIRAWERAYELGREYGFRNAQVTVIAPTGTISFLMQADTTGIEPMLGVVTYKKLVGGGFMKLANELVEPSLSSLGYSTTDIGTILKHIEDTGDIHSAPAFNIKHSPVFATSLGNNAVSPIAHIKMMAAVQPFLSGGISKTVNMPSDCTPEDIGNVYMDAWKSGVKCVAVYRDGCKLSQPISTSIKTSTDVVTASATNSDGLSWGDRRKLPETCTSVRHKFIVGGQEGYIHVGMYEDGTLGELFVDIAKAGSTLNGILEAWATNLSIAIQHGVSLELLKEKHIDMKFEPSGFTSNKEIPIAKSIPDYIFRWLDLQFGKKVEEIQMLSPETVKASKADISKSHDGPPCLSCGNMTKRAGSCYCCTSCGATTGCS